MSAGFFPSGVPMKKAGPSKATWNQNEPEYTITNFNDAAIEMSWGFPR